MKKIFLAIFIFSVFLTPQFSYAFSVGDLWDSFVSFLDSGVMGQDNIASVSRIDATSGPLKTLVLLVKFEDALDPTVNSNTISRSNIFNLFSSNGFIQRYLREVSYGKFSLSIGNQDIFPVDGSYYTLRKSEYDSSRPILPNQDSGGGPIMTEVSKILSNLITATDLLKYKYIIVIYPQARNGSTITSYLDNNAKISVGGQTKTLPVAVVSATNNSMKPMMVNNTIGIWGTSEQDKMKDIDIGIIHETLHALDVGHAGSVDRSCINNSIYPTENCTNELGNKFDIMSGVPVYGTHPTAYSKDIMGWLSVSDGTLKVVEQLGTTKVTLYPLESQISGVVKGVKIQSLNKAYPPIYVEHRVGGGNFDHSIKRTEVSAAQNSLFINVPLLRYGLSKDPLLLTEYRSGGILGGVDFPLSTFDEPSRGIKIGNVRKINNPPSISFDVTLTQSGCASGDLEIFALPDKLRMVGVAGQKDVLLSETRGVTIKNTDSLGCAPSNIKILTEPLKIGSDTLYHAITENMFVLSPGETKKINITTVAPSSLSAGEYDLPIKFLKEDNTSTIVKNLKIIYSTIDLYEINGPKLTRPGTEREFVFNVSNPDEVSLKYYVDKNDGKGLSEVFSPRVKIKFDNQGLYILTFIIKTTDGLLEKRIEYPVMVANPSFVLSLSKNLGNEKLENVEFTIKASNLECNSEVVLNYGENLDSKKNIKASCPKGKFYLDEGDIRDTHSYYQYGIHNAFVSMGDFKSNQVQLNIKPKAPTDVRSARTDKNMTLEWWRTAWDGNLDTQIMVSSEKLSTEDQNFSWNFYGDLTAGESGIFKCKPEDSRQNTDCAIKVFGNKSPKLVFELGSNVQKPLYFYMRTVDKNKVIASDTIEYISLPPNDFTPGDDIIQSPNPANPGDFVTVTFSAKRNNSVGLQTVSNRLKFNKYGGSDLRPIINLDSENGVSAAETANGGLVLGSYIIPITFQNGQTEASRTVLIKFNQQIPSTVTPIFEVNVGRFKEFVAESNKANNVKSYDQKLTFEKPPLLNASPVVMIYSVNEGQKKSYADNKKVYLTWILDKKHVVDGFVVVRSSVDIPDSIGSVVSCLGTEGTLCSVPGVTTSYSYVPPGFTEDPSNDYEFWDNNVKNGTIYNYRIYGYKNGVGYTKLSYQVSFTPSLRVEATLTPIRVVSRSPEYTYAKTILEVKSIAGTDLSYFTIDTKSISSDTYIVYTNNDPTCKEFMLREAKKCPINLKIHPNAVKNYQRISLPIILRDEKTVVARPEADLVLWPKEFFPRESSYVSIGGITGSSQGSRKIDFNTQNIKEGEIKGFYIPKSGGQWTPIGTAPIASKSLNWSGFGSLPQGEYFVRLCRSYPELNGFFDICSQTVNTFK